MREQNNLRVAVDTGSTFTDCVYIEDGQLKVLKVFSTPADPSQAVLDALEQIGPGVALDVRHGTTIGTNAMLERKGARVAFVMPGLFRFSSASPASKNCWYRILRSDGSPCAATAAVLVIFAHSLGCDTSLK